MRADSSARILTLLKILFEETDEHHNELSLTEIIDKLNLYFPDSNFDKRTIRGDIALIDEMDFEIIQNQGKYGKILYSHQNRIFETYELRLMTDAILSAKFITENDKNKLIHKVKQLTSKHIAKTLPEPFVFSQSSNEHYELVKLNIDCIHEAISDRKVITYQYGRYNVDKEFEYSRNGSFYTVEPYGLIWQNDFYYLIAKYLETGEMRHYRLDRIRNIAVTSRSFEKLDFDLQSYINHSFHMFAGEEIRIKVQFHMNLVNVVLDRFGQDVDIRKIDEDTFLLTTKAKLSDGLINWILTWGNQVKVLEPDYLVDRVYQKIKKMLAVYE